MQSSFSTSSSPPSTSYLGQSWLPWRIKKTLTLLASAIDRWGHLAEGRVNPNSLSRILRLAFVRSGVAGESYTAHSLRRGFATWASRNQWSSKALMEYVGWRDVQSATRYIEADAPFGDWAR